MTYIKRLLRALEVTWAEWRLSRLTDIPFRTIHNMTEQEAMDAFVVEPGECPWAGEHTETYPNESDV